jgi:TrmH family RNA methyltransferase
MYFMISSTSNEKVNNIINLKKSARARNEQQCFLVEGPRMFFEVPSSRLKEVYLTPDFEKKYADRLEEYRYELMSDSICRHLSDTKTPQGVVAVVDRVERSLDEILGAASSPCLILLENLQDPGNLGTILRTAEASGITGIIMNQGSVDPYNPKVVRSTMGAVFRIPFLVVKDFPSVIAELKAKGITIYAAHLQGEVFFYDADYTKACGFLIGNEGRGLSEETSALADRRIRIPMKGQVESLNASVAASLIMYEAMKQRDEKYV